VDQAAHAAGGVEHEDDFDTMLLRGQLQRGVHGLCRLCLLYHGKGGDAGCRRDNQRQGDHLAVKGILFHGVSPVSWLMF